MGNRKRIKTHKTPPKKVASFKVKQVEHKVIDHTILSQSVGIIKQRRRERANGVLLELAEICEKIDFDYGENGDQSTAKNPLK